MHNYHSQALVGKAILILTYPLAIGIHLVEWKRERKLKRMIRKWIGKACKNPQGIEAEMVEKWSAELREIYGK